MHRLLVFTGDGKGKTTAALGMALRAVGHGHRVLFVQFIKSDASTGEALALRRMPGAELVISGRGFTPPREHPAYQDHRRAAQTALAMVNAAVREGRHKLVVLDEVCTAVARGLLDDADVVEVAGRAGAGVCVIMTGRMASPALIAAADTATDMRCLKHAHQQGRPAEKGVEW